MDKTLQITGQVFVGWGKVFFSAGKKLVVLVECKFDRKQEEILKEFSPGQVLTVRGIVGREGGFGGYAFILDKCEFVKVGEKKGDVEPSKKIPPKVGPELAKFQGTWTVAKSSIAGVDAPPDQLKKMTLVISGDRAVKAGNADDPATLKLNATTSPAQVDFIDSNNMATRGIYRFIDSNTLEICMNVDDNGPRPTAFAAQKGSGNMLARLQRAK